MLFAQDGVLRRTAFQSQRFRQASREICGCVPSPSPTAAVLWTRAPPAMRRAGSRPPAAHSGERPPQKPPGAYATSADGQALGTRYAASVQGERPSW